LLLSEKGGKWLSCNTHKMIRQKHRIHRKAKHFKNPMHWNKFRKIRNEVTSLVRSSTSFSHNLISLIWFVTCDKLGILLLESSISDCLKNIVVRVEYIVHHFQDYLFQYISHQYQNLLYCNSSQYILSTYNSQHNNNNNVVLATVTWIIDDYDRLTDWIRPLTRGLAIYSLTDSWKPNLPRVKLQ
jgi:hypothetical protein